MKTAVVVDSGSYFYTQNIDLEGLFAIPLQIIDGDTAYLECVDITIDQVNDLMKEGKMLHTSLPSIGKIETLFKELKLQGYERIFAVPITSGISGTLNAMTTAATFAEIAFDYIDCYSTAYIQLELAQAARRMFDMNMDIEIIKQCLYESIEHSNTFVIPNDLTHLSRGGRLSPLAATLGGFLKIKPILHLNQQTKGIIDPFDKVRTMTKAVDTVIHAMKDAGVNEDYVLIAVDVDAPKELESAIIKLKEAFPTTEIRMDKLIPTVSVHVGLGSLAFQYMKKPKF